MTTIIIIVILVLLVVAYVMMYNGLVNLGPTLKKPGVKLTCSCNGVTT